MRNGKDTIMYSAMPIAPDGLTELSEVLGLAAELMVCDIAQLNFIDDLLKGLDLKWGKTIPLDKLNTFFSNLILKSNEMIIIPNTLKHFNSIDILPALSSVKLRFFVGIPVFLGDGRPIGSLCLFAKKTKTVTESEKKILHMFSRQIGLIIENEISRRKLVDEIEEKEARTDSLLKIAQLQSHQIRRPLTTLMGLVNLIKDEIHPVDQEWMTMFETATKDFDKTIHMIVDGSMASKDLKAIRFNKMVEEIDDYAILILDGDGYIENWNRGAERIKGYRYDEIVGQHFSVFYTDEDRQNKRPQKLIMEAEKHGVARDLGWRLRKDGTLFWGSIVITSIHDNNGAVIGFTKVTRDLTEITEVRDSLIASEELYKMMVEKTGALARIGGWELDVVHKFLSWTSVTKEIHGVDRDYVPELTSAINFYKEGTSRDKIKEAVKLAIETGRPWDMELQIVTAQGKEIRVRATGKSNYKDGICTKVYGTFQDINALRI
ncbi:PAS domain S-box protein [Flavobacterium sp. WV_118_3]|uniref:PAS domain S-box protein n=1 Tax=Flavobacterium sp. WV_118_3 TaxID=3151764 RepID=UPI00321B5B37